jgi:nitrite reductase/ring-hydroxylating ferredoxin subunit
LNTAALGLFTVSLIARRRGSRGVGKALSLTGFSILMSSAYLGGHLSYSQGVNVNRTAWRHGPADWTAVMTDSDLGDGQPAKKAVADVTVLLYRSGGSITAIDSVCSHMGGPLEEGTIADGGCVTCPWHGSTFKLEDGGIVRGPASNPQPGYQVRVREGQIEVRRRQLQG